MKAIIQRVNAAKLSVEGTVISEIGKGLVVYFGVDKKDEERTLEYFSKKISRMRIFSDENGKMNLSVSDVNGSILLVSQFTLAADCRRGNRPDFTGAEEPVAAKVLYLKLADLLRAEGAIVKLGVFGADMLIEQQNDGPVTIILQEPSVVR